MSFWSRIGNGLAAGLLTDSFSGAAAAALTDNFGIGVATGVGSRLLDMNYASAYPAWGGGYAWGGWGGGMDTGFSNYMYNASYNDFFDRMATTIAWY